MITVLDVCLGLDFSHPLDGSRDPWLMAGRYSLWGRWQSYMKSMALWLGVTPLSKSDPWLTGVRERGCPRMGCSRACLWCVCVNVSESV